MESQIQKRTRNNSIMNYFQLIKNNLQESGSESEPEIKKKKRKKNDDSDFSLNHKEEIIKDSASDSDCGQKKRKNRSVQIKDDDFEFTENLDQYGKLPKNIMSLKKMLNTVNQKIKEQRKKFFEEVYNQQFQKSKVNEQAIPICSDIRKFNWDNLIKNQLKFAQQKYDVIMMDPPWQLSSSNPSRGVAIAYNSLADEIISNIPVPKLQTQGFCLIWVINAKYRFSVKLLENWGYTLVDEITWVKKTINGKIAKGHGFYLQHAKESCLVGVKGKPKYNKNICSDIIFSLRRGQSQKPTEIYEYVEELVPNGYCLEIFARRNNLRSNWTSIGNEL